MSVTKYILTAASHKANIEKSNAINSENSDEDTYTI